MQPAARSQPGTASVAVALGTIYLVWGSTYLAIRIMVETVPPFLGAGIRFVIAGALILGFAWATGRLRRSRGGGVGRIGWREWRSTAIVGAFLMLGGNGFVVLAEQHIDSGVAAILIAAVPIWMNLLEAIVTRRRPSWLAVGGVIAGFGGVLVLLAPVNGVSAVDPAGIGLAVFASLSWAVGSIYARGAPMPRSGMLATGMEQLAGGVLLTAAGVLTGEVARTDPASLSTASLLAVVYLLVFGSFLGFTAYTWLLKHTPVATAATYAYVNPIVAVVLGALILGESLTLRTLVAAVLIIGAVAAMVTGRPREVEELPPAPEPVLEVIELTAADDRVGQDP